MSEYEYVYPGTNITIQDIQKIELDMMIELDRICRKHNIPYQIFGGTLLGAVRHKGFIPWDDDADIAMLREDYDKFIKVASMELKDSYFLQTCFTDPTSIIQFAKLRKNGTVYENKLEYDVKYHTGVWIDVFPFDNVKLDKHEVSKMKKKLSFLYVWTTSTLWGRVKYTRGLHRKIIRSILHFFGLIVGKRKIDGWLKKEYTKFDHEKTEYVSHLTNGLKKKTFVFPGQNGKVLTNVQRREKFTDLTELEFCGHMFYAPRNYKDVLTDTYGDYMKLPPEEARFPWHDVVSVRI